MKLDVFVVIVLYVSMMFYACHTVCETMTEKLFSAFYLQSLLEQIHLCLNSYFKLTCVTTCFCVRRIILCTKNEITVPIPCVLSIVEKLIHLYGVFLMSLNQVKQPQIRKLINMCTVIGEAIYHKSSLGRQHCKLLNSWN